MAGPLSNVLFSNSEPFSTGNCSTSLEVMITNSRQMQGLRIRPGGTAVCDRPGQNHRQSRRLVHPKSNQDPRLRRRRDERVRFGCRAHRASTRASSTNDDTESPALRAAAQLGANALPKWLRHPDGYLADRSPTTASIAPRTSDMLR